MYIHTQCLPTCGGVCVSDLYVCWLLFVIFFFFFPQPFTEIKIEGKPPQLLGID